MAHVGGLWKNWKDIEDYQKEILSKIAASTMLPYSAFLNQPSPSSAFEIKMRREGQEKKIAKMRDGVQEVINITIKHVALDCIEDGFRHKTPRTGDTIQMIDDINRVEETPHRAFQRAINRAARKIRDDLDRRMSLVRY